MANESSYTEERATFICEWVASGKTLNKLCLTHKERVEEQPPEGETEAEKEARTYKYNRKTVYRWFDAYEDFKTRYELARTFQREVWADEIIDIGNDTSNDVIQGPKGPVPNHAAVQRAALRTGDRKWILSKLVPKQYGDKPEGDKPKGEINNGLRPIVLNVLPKPDN